MTSGAPEIGASSYLDQVIGLLQELRTASRESIAEAADVIARSIEQGHRIWIASTTYTLHEEATGRAGGFMAAHVLTDTALVGAGDCVLVGSPVGTSARPIDVTHDCQLRGATVIALTNTAFELDERTLLEHSTKARLHEIADLVIDVPGPFGDGMFEVPELALRAIPHSGVTGVATMWMIFSEVLAVMRRRGITPRLYECVNVSGAREKNRAAIAGYVASGRGYLLDGELDDQD